MNKKQVWLLLLSFLFSSSFLGCIEANAKDKAHSKVGGKAQQVRHVPRSYRSFPAFSSIKATGNFSLTIVPSTKKHQVLLSGDEAAIADMSTYVVNDTLYLRQQVLQDKTKDQVKNRLEKTKYPNLMVTVYVSTLHHLSYSGTGTIRANHLKSPALDLLLNHNGDVYISGHIGLHQLQLKGNGRTVVKGIDSRDMHITMDGRPHVELHGTVNLQNLNYQGQGSLYLYWVGSHDLNVVGKGDATAHLAGVVNTLYVSLYDRATLDAKYLRAQEVFVKAFDATTAEIQAIDTQNVLASDRSTVYFYKDPKLDASFMAYQGAVLDMESVPYALWDQRG